MPRRSNARSEISASRPSKRTRKPEVSVKDRHSSLHEGFRANPSPESCAKRPFSHRQPVHHPRLSRSVRRREVASPGHGKAITYHLAASRVTPGFSHADGSGRGLSFSRACWRASESAGSRPDGAQRERGLGSAGVRGGSCSRHGPGTSFMEGEGRRHLNGPSSPGDSSWAWSAWASSSSRSCRSGSEGTLANSGS